MKIKLTLVSVKKIIEAEPGAVYLYGDFNVLNILYEKNMRLGSDIIIYPDSSLVYFVLKYYYGYNYRMIVSTDLQYNLLRLSMNKNKRLFFFGDHEDVLSKIKMNLEYGYHEIETFPGFEYTNKDVLKRINSIKPDILFVGLGAGRQEQWIIDNLSLLEAGVVLSVGGWFQYLSGIKNRGPQWMINFHLEWLFKLVLEFPRIWKRYFWGATVFLYRVLSKKIILVMK